MKLQAISDGLRRRPCGTVRSMADLLFGASGEPRVDWVEPGTAGRRPSRAVLAHQRVGAAVHAVATVAPEDTTSPWLGRLHAVPQRGRTPLIRSQQHGVVRQRWIVVNPLAAQAGTIRPSPVCPTPCLDKRSHALAWPRSAPVMASAFLYDASRHLDHKRHLNKREPTQIHSASLKH